MAKPNIDAEIALHEFSVRYRAALAKRPGVADHIMGNVKNAVREQYEKERAFGIQAPTIERPKIEEPRIQEPRIEAPKIERPKIQAPKIEPPRIEGPEPEI